MLSFNDLEWTVMEGKVPGGKASAQPIQVHTEDTLSMKVIETEELTTSRDPFDVAEMRAAFCEGLHMKKNKRAFRWTKPKLDIIKCS